MVESSLVSAQVSMKALNDALESYRCLRQIGHGAMGIVYEAEQNRLGRRVALKLLPPNLALRERTVRRFLREAEAMGRLGHPNIVDVYDVGSVREFHYFTMRYVEGPPLDKVLKAGPLAIGDVLSIGIDVATALAHAHARGVLHRDVKPGNLLRDGEKVVLTDFGLARPMDADDGGSVTESGDLVGTPLYMAPEQISGDFGRIDGRADVWGLGVTLYELLSERAPFSGVSASSILHAILHRDPPRLRKLRADVPPDLEAVVHHCLEKDLQRRYTTAAALADDLIAIREGRPVGARAPRFTDPLERWIRRHPAEAGIVAASVLVTVAIGAGGWWFMANSKAKEKRASDRQVEAERQRDEIRVANTAQIASQMVSELGREWSSGFEDGDEPRCREAELELFELLDAGALSELPDIRAEALTVAAEWARRRERSPEQVLAALEPYLGTHDSDNALLNRAAVHAGLRQHEEAIDIHRQRARMFPRSPRPWIDAAVVERRRALEELRDQDLASAERDLRLAIRDLGAAIALARTAGGRELAAGALTERAQCWIDLGRPELALLDLGRVLEHDPTRVNAQALVLTARRHIENGTGWGSHLPDPAPTADLPEPGPSATVEPAPRSEPAAPEQGFRPLFKAFQRLLQDAGEPRPAGEQATEPSQGDG